MNRQEFDQRINLITSLKQDVKIIKDEVSYKASQIANMSAAYFTGQDNKNKDFEEYFNLLKEFDFSDNLTTPSDLFPGIRTTAVESDPEELQRKADTMKSLAANIDSLHKESSASEKNIIDALKRCLSLMSEYILRQDQIYDLELDLLNDMNSIYDVGQLASNS